MPEVRFVRKQENIIRASLVYFRVDTDNFLYALSSYFRMIMRIRFDLELLNVSNHLD